MLIISCWGSRGIRMVNSWYNRGWWRASLAEVPPASVTSSPFVADVKSQPGPAGMTILSPVLGKGVNTSQEKFSSYYLVCRHRQNNHNLSQQRVESQRPAFQKAADLPGKQRLGLLNGRETKRHPPFQKILLPTWVHIPLEMARGWIPQIHLTLALTPPPQLLYFISKLIMNPDHSPNFLSV